MLGISSCLNVFEQLQQQDAGYGAILGACVGDAAGAVLEFINRKPTVEEVNAALRMPGGGVWDVGAGQVTDDSEMALCLLQALMDYPASAFSPLPAAGTAGPAAAAGSKVLDAIAQWYGRWLHSPPFDIGTTTRQALDAAKSRRVLELEAAGLASKMRQRAERVSRGQ